MNIERKNIDEVNATLTLVVEKSDYKDNVEKALRSYRQKAVEPGFRPGHVPASIVQKKYGKAVLADELNKLVGEKLYSYIKENDIKALGEPLPSADQKEHDLDADTFEFVFDIAIAPELNIELNKDFALPYYEIEVDSDMVDNSVASYESRLGSRVEADEVGEEDMVKGQIKELASDSPIQKAAMFVPKFTMKNEAQRALFIGAKKGDAIVFNPKTAIENENEIASFLGMAKEQAASITSDFEFTIETITHYNKPEMNQAFFDQIFGEGVVKSEEEFRAKVKEDIAASLVGDSDYKFLLDMRDALLKKVDGVVFPDAFLKRWVLATSEGKATEEDIENQYPQMKKEWLWHLLKEKFAKDFKIKVDDADIKEFAKKAAKAQFAQYDMMSVPEDVLENYVKDMLSKKENLHGIVDRTVEDKLISVAKDAVKLETKSLSLDGFNKLFEVPEAPEA